MQQNGREGTGNREDGMSVSFSFCATMKMNKKKWRRVESEVRCVERRVEEQLHASCQKRQAQNLITSPGAVAKIEDK